MSAPRLRFLVLFIAAAFGGPWSVGASAQTADDDDLPFVAATAIVRDAAVDALYIGMKDALRAAGYRDGETVRLTFASAESDAGRAADLVQGFARERADVIVAFTEPSVRIAAAERLRVPLVIAGVGPAIANALRRDRQARLLTGIVDDARFDAPLRLVREIAPSVRTVAIPVDADRPVDQDALRQTTAFARSIDLTIEQLPVSLENGAIAATIRHYARDEVAILLDKRIFPDAPVARLIAAAEASNLLVFASDEDSVVRGALAAVVAEPYGTGWQLGELVARILEQPSAARTPLQAAEPSYVVINQDTAARAAIEIPEAVLARRGRVIDWADIAGPRPRGKPVVVPSPPADEPQSDDASPRSTPPDQAR